MFVEKHEIRTFVVGDDGKVVVNTDGNLKTRAITDEEKFNLQKNGDGRIHIATNGIFNDQSAAAKYADQHNITNQPQYFVAFPEADGVVSELMIAGYQKMLEGDKFGLTNSTQQVKELMTIYGNEGLHLDAHSRGSMTVGNALRSFAADPASYGMLSNTVITFFGPAFNAQEADGLLALLQSRQNKDPATQASYDLKMQNHFNDIVGVFSGGNPSTGGFVP